MKDSGLHGARIRLLVYTIAEIVITASLEFATKHVGAQDYVQVVVDLDLDYL